MKTRKYWPLDPDPEGEIYENPAWDLPGFKRGQMRPPKKAVRHARAANQLVQR